MYEREKNKVHQSNCMLQYNAAFSFEHFWSNRCLRYMYASMHLHEFINSNFMLPCSFILAFRAVNNIQAPLVSAMYSTQEK